MGLSEVKIRVGSHHRDHEPMVMMATQINNIDEETKMHCPRRFESKVGTGVSNTSSYLSLLDFQA